MVPRQATPCEKAHYEGKLYTVTRWGTKTSYCCNKALGTKHDVNRHGTKRYLTCCKKAHYPDKLPAYCNKPRYLNKAVLATQAIHALCTEAGYMLQTGRVTRHAYNAKTSYTLHEGTLRRQAEYCNKVGYQHKLTRQTIT